MPEADKYKERQYTDQRKEHSQVQAIKQLKFTKNKAKTCDACRGIF